MLVCSVHLISRLDSQSKLQILLFTPFTYRIQGGSAIFVFIFICFYVLISVHLNAAILVATEFNGAWVEGRMWLQIHNTMILSFTYLLVFVRNAEIVRKIASQVYCKGMKELNRLTGGVTLHVLPILFRDDRLQVKNRWKRRLDFVKAKRAKRERASRLGVRCCVLCVSNQMISFDVWILRKRKGLCGIHGLSKTNLVKIWETAVSQCRRRAETDDWRIVS